MIESLASILLISGSVFILIASIGILKLPDIYMRMSSTTKAATLGVGLVLLGTALFFSEVGVTTRALTIILFLLLTAPVAAHMIGRASYFDGQPLWDKTLIDELKDRIDLDSHKISSKCKDEEKDESC